MDWKTLLATTHGRQATVLVVGFLLCAGVVIAQRLRQPKTHKRGTLVKDGAAAQRAGRRLHRRRPDILTLASIALPPLDETKHFKLIGTTGTGKSTAIRELLAGALKRGDRAIIADPNGGYRAHFYNRYRGDVTLNPFDSDSVKWNLFEEIREPYDVEQVSSGLIPSVEDASGQEWRGYARTFLAAVIRRCHESGCHDTAELWRLLEVASGEELRSIVRDTPAQPDRKSVV